MSNPTLMSDRSTRILRIAGWSLAASLLALPAIAMQFTTEVMWTTEDFVFAGIVFGIVGGLFELAARASGNFAFRAATVAGVACAFLQLWISLAVGIIGSEHDPANWTYFAVILMAVAGSAVAFGNPRALSRAMIVAGCGQALFSVLHALDGQMTVVIDLFFIALWSLSAWLFARAARQIDAQ